FSDVALDVRSKAEPVCAFLPAYVVDDFIGAGLARLRRIVVDSGIKARGPHHSGPAGAAGHKRRKAEPRARFGTLRSGSDVCNVLPEVVLDTHVVHQVGGKGAGQ